MDDIKMKAMKHRTVDSRENGLLLWQTVIDLIDLDQVGRAVELFLYAEEHSSVPEMICYYTGTHKELLVIRKMASELIGKALNRDNGED